MATKTFAAGDVLTASDVNTYLSGEGGAWTSWTPAVVQSGSVTATVTRGKYARYGRTIHFSALLSITGTGTAANDITVSLPVTAATTVGSNSVIGVGQLYDASANIVYHGPLIATSTTVVKILAISGAGAPFYLGSGSFTAALANTDSITVSGTYESAT